MRASSSKNFLVYTAEALRDPKRRDDAEAAVFQLGKLAPKTFALDFRHPMSALQAFGVALAAFRVEGTARRAAHLARRGPGRRENLSSVFGLNHGPFATPRRQRPRGLAVDGHDDARRRRAAVRGGEQPVDAGRQRQRAPVRRQRPVAVCGDVATPGTDQRSV